jgi:phosphoserine phosphatase
MDDAIHKRLTPSKKLAIFNMDHTILRSGFMQAAAKEFGFVKELTHTGQELYRPIY